MIDVLGYFWLSNVVVQYLLHIKIIHLSFL